MRFTGSPYRGELLAFNVYEDYVETMRLWDSATGEIRTVFGDTVRAISRVCPVPVDGRDLLACAFRDEGIHLWDPVTGEFSNLGRNHTGDVEMCVLLVDGRHLLASGSGETIHLWDPVTGRLHATIGINAEGPRETHETPARSWLPWKRSAGPGGGTAGDDAACRQIHCMCAVRVDGRQLLASAGDDRAVRVWDPVTGELRSALRGHFGTVRRLCVVQVDGCQLLASAAEDETVRVWDPATGTLRTTLEGHTGPVNGVCAVQVDGRQFLASAGKDKTVRVWDPVDGRQFLASVGEDGIVRGCGTRPVVSSAPPVKGA